MLNDSTSPQKELQSLLDWQELAETKEALAHLNRLAAVADRLAKASPLAFPRAQTVNADGQPFQIQLDGHTIETLRHQSIGENRGMNELSRLLLARRLELETTIEQQEKDSRNQTT